MSLILSVSILIITDDSGKILYNVNDGYISEKNKFSVFIDPRQANGFGSNIAYLIDSKNTIKYSTQLDILLNMNKLKEQSPIGKFYSDFNNFFIIKCIE